MEEFRRVTLVQSNSISHRIIWHYVALYMVMGEWMEKITAMPLLAMMMMCGMRSRAR